MILNKFKTMNKNILIITPFFPPQTTDAAVFRAFKLVKYLKRTGWNPIDTDG